MLAIHDPELVEMMAKAHFLDAKMGYLPRSQYQRQQFQFSSAITPSATIHTYGSWASLMTSVPFDCDLWRVDIYNSDAVEGVLDLGLGPTGGGSEQTIISLPFRQHQDLANNYMIPLLLKSGQRISGRVKMNKASGSTSFPDLNFIGANSVNEGPARQRATTYGLTNETGVTVTTGASNIQGAYAQITGSTTNPIRQLLVCVTLSGTAPGSDVLLQMDLGIGAGGSEKLLLDNLYFYYVQNRTVWPNSWTIPCEIPAGTRIALRLIAPNNTATYALNCSVIGID